MGMGSLKRIAALCTLGTLALLVAGGMSVPAAVTLPSTEPVTSTLNTVTSTVPTTTVRVPSTSTTTPTTTTPTVSTPTVEPTKTVKDTTTTVTNTVKTVTSSPTKTTTTSGSGSSGGSVTKTIDSATQTVGDATGTTTGSLGSSSTGSGSGLIGGTSSGGGSGTSGTGTGTGTDPFGGGPSGPAGPTGSGPGRSYFGAGGGPGSLSAMLAAGVSSKQLRAALEQFEGCLPALPLLDRRVLSMRAGAGGAPLSRSQVAARLGLSRGAVRAAERRGLTRLVVTAEQTGCATTVVGPFDPAGIGPLTAQIAIAGAVPVNGPGARAGGDFGATRGIQARSSSPLIDLGGAPEGGPAWAIVLFTVLFSVSIAALMREVRSSV